MALAGVHVVCGFVGNHGRDGVVQALFDEVIWSETIGSTATTTQAAPSGNPGSGRPCFEIRSAVDVYVAKGRAPDASQAVGGNNTARIFVPAGETRNIFGRGGDKIACVAA